MITVVIPARMNSSRYPGKPLASILGVPMIEHVRRRALLAKGVDHVVVATCDMEIKTQVESFGGHVVMTRSNHERCTDRVQEAMTCLPGDIVVMVQGDEPLLDPELIQLVIQPLLDDDDLNVVNVLSPIETTEDFINANIVKGACDLAKNIIYLTRSAIPCFRKVVDVPIFRQTGIMAFRSSFLPKFSSLPETALEIAESIDMLRLIEHGICIRGVIIDHPTIGVDQISDIRLVEQALMNDPKQILLNNRIKDFKHYD